MQTESSPSVKVFYPAFELEDLIGRLRSGLKQLSAMLPLRQSVLFGSWAQGKQTAFSDIDLLVVYTVEGARKIGHMLTRMTEGGIVLWETTEHPEPSTEYRVYTVEEARKIGHMLTRMTEGGIVLWETTGPPEPSTENRAPSTQYRAPSTQPRAPRTQPRAPSTEPRVPSPEPHV